MLKSVKPCRACQRKRHTYMHTYSYVCIYIRIHIHTISIQYPYTRLNIITLPRQVFPKRKFPFFVLYTKIVQFSIQLPLQVAAVQWIASPIVLSVHAPCVSDAPGRLVLRTAGWPSCVRRLNGWSLQCLNVPEKLMFYIKN